MAKKFRLPSAYVILFVIIVFLAVLTWLIPAGQYEYFIDAAGVQKPVAGSYHTVASNPQGIFDVLLAPVSGFVDGIEVIVFILIIGGYLGIIMSTDSINIGIKKLISSLNQKEKWLIPILMIFFAIGGSTYGMAEETLAFYPILLPAFLAAGYDRMTGVCVILLGSGVGVIGSTTNPFATGIGSGFADVSIGDGLLLRVLILIILTTFSIIFVMRYAKKVKTESQLLQNDPEFAAGTVSTEDEKLTNKHKWVLILFGFTFLFMIYAVIPFADIGLTFLPTLGWWFIELGAFFLISGVLIGKFFGLKEGQIITGFLTGATEMLGVVFIIGLSRGITIIMNDGLITDTILHYGEMLLLNTGSFVFSFLTYLFYFPISFLVPSTSGLATLTMPILAPMADFAGISRALVVTIMQSAAGIVNLITPTSAVVMSALAFGKISFDQWLKFVWKFVLIVFVLIGAMILLAVFI